MKPMLLFVVIALLSSFGAAQAAPQSDTVLTITGEGITPIGLSLADLMKLPTETVRGVDHDKQEYAFEGVDVYRILSLAGVRFADTLKGRIFTSTVLVVRAMDNYEAVFALAELDPTDTESPVILAFRQDGKPLPAKDGILRIISPREKRHIRWVRQVQSFEVQQVK